jgi:hypothetical protein
MQANDVGRFQNVRSLPFANSFPLSPITFFLGADEQAMETLLLPRSSDMDRLHLLQSGPNLPSIPNIYD